MTWASFPWGAVLTVAGLVSAVLLLAMDERARRKFATREDVNGLTRRIDKDMDGLGRKAERNTGLFVQLDDRVGDLEEKAALLEERQSQQWERISEQMAQTARTIESVVARMERVSEIQQEFALQLERMRSGRSSGAD